jgi:hypothetical protein
MQKNAFYGYKESQAQYGYRSAVLYRNEGEGKYKFLCASETVPFPFGTKETAEFNLMNSPIVGQVEGKDTLEQKEIQLLYTRNNAILFEKLKGKVLEFMSLTPQLVGYKYSGTIAFRPDDATNDIHRGTYTITPMNADTTPCFTARDECKLPIFFKDVIPDELSIANDAVVEGSSNVIKINVATNVASANVEYYYSKFGEDGKEGTAQTKLTPASGTTIISLPATAGLYVIYAKPVTASADTYSECFTSVYITE